MIIDNRLHRVLTAARHASDVTDAPAPSRDQIVTLITGIAIDPLARTAFLSIVCEAVVLAIRKRHDPIVERVRDRDEDKAWRKEWGLEDSTSAARPHNRRQRIGVIR